MSFGMNEKKLSPDSLHSMMSAGQWKEWADNSLREIQDLMLRALDVAFGGGWYQGGCETNIPTMTLRLHKRKADGHCDQGNMVRIDWNMLGMTGFVLEGRIDGKKIAVQGETLDQAANAAKILATWTGPLPKPPSSCVIRLILEGNRACNGIPMFSAWRIGDKIWTGWRCGSCGHDIQAPVPIVQEQNRINAIFAEWDAIRMNELKAAKR